MKLHETLVNYVLWQIQPDTLYEIWVILEFRSQGTPSATRIIKLKPKSILNTIHSLTSEDPKKEPFLVGNEQSMKILVAKKVLG